MAATLALISGPTFSGKEKKYVFGVTLTGSYPGTNGDVLDFSPHVSGNVNALPVSVVAEGSAGYPAQYVPGATIKLGKLKFYSAPATELTTAAYPAGLLGATTLKLTVTF